MTVELKRTEAEINEQLDRATHGVEEGTQYLGMSYEEGVRETIQWLLGYTNDKPMEDI